ncbi:MAG: hypothetical protein ABSF95_18270 [Verrucomicrobiota bacterium]|jgi:hypothetical protein
MKTYFALIAALATPLLAANTSPAQVSQAQAQLDQAQAQLERAQAAADNAQADVTGAPLAQESYSVNAPMAVSVSPWNWDATAPAGRTLVIPKEAAEPKDLPQFEEELNIMARILRKAAGGATEKSRSAMGIFIHNHPFGEGAAPQNLYLEGYGALFFLDVNYPLVAPPAKKAEAETKQETSSEWEEARHELHHEAAPPDVNYLDMQPFMSSGPAPEQYDADKVERLKSDLLSALKNAAHIRHLKAEETVTVLVAGRGGKGESRLLTRPPGAYGGGMGGGTMGGNMMGGGGLGGGMGGGGFASSGVRAVTRTSAGGQAGRLILRARKSDIDAFQKEKLSLEDFRKKVTVILH